MQALHESPLTTAMGLAPATGTTIVPGPYSTPLAVYSPTNVVDDAYSTLAQDARSPVTVMPAVIPPAPKAMAPDGVAGTTTAAVTTPASRPAVRRRDRIRRMRDVFSGLTYRTWWR